MQQELWKAFGWLSEISIWLQGVDIKEMVQSFERTSHVPLLSLHHSNLCGFMIKTPSHLKS